MSLFYYTFIFSGLCVQTSVTIYGSTGTVPGNALNAASVRVYCSGKLYHLNEEVKFLYKKKQIPNELLYRTQLKSASQWQVMWLCIETAINVKFYNMNGILYDRWNTSYITHII